MENRMIRRSFFKKSLAFIGGMFGLGAMTGCPNPPSNSDNEAQDPVKFGLPKTICGRPVCCWWVFYRETFWIDVICMKITVNELLARLPIGTKLTIVAKFCNGASVPLPKYPFRNVIENDGHEFVTDWNINHTNKTYINFDNTRWTDSEIDATDKGFSIAYGGEKGVKIEYAYGHVKAWVIKFAQNVMVGRFALSAPVVAGRSGIRDAGSVLALAGVGGAKEPEKSMSSCRWLNRWKY
jgi:hypothetical protein